MFSAVTLSGSAQTFSAGAISSKRSEHRDAQNARRLDPGKTGWDTEVFSQQAEAQLLLLADWLKQHDGRDLNTLAPLLAEGFVSDRLVPDQTMMKTEAG